jgi:hypothetical protein
VLSIALPRVPVKPLSGRLQVTPQDCRIFNCQRCHCQVRICRRCDRGNRYCRSCAPLARVEKQREAGRRYQNTENGRLNHKVRHEQYKVRLQEKVTHQGDLGIADKQKSVTATIQGSSDISNDRRREPPEPLSGPGRCDFCGRPCNCPGRTGPLPRRAHAYRRGPRLPRPSPGRQRGWTAAIAMARRRAGNGSEMKDERKDSFKLGTNPNPEIGAATLLLPGVPAAPGTDPGAATAVADEPSKNSRVRCGSKPAIAAWHARANPSAESSWHIDWCRRIDSTWLSDTHSGIELTMRRLEVVCWR